MFEPITTEYIHLKVDRDNVGKFVRISQASPLSGVRDDEIVISDKASLEALITRLKLTAKEW